jgi:hypothetical protein
LSTPSAPVGAFGIRAERFFFFPRLCMAKFAPFDLRFHGENLNIFTLKPIGLLSHLLKSSGMQMAALNGTGPGGPGNESRSPGRFACRTINRITHKEIAWAMDFAILCSDEGPRDFTAPLDQCGAP